jgi:AcrR family transcriptional regulator
VPASPRNDPRSAGRREQIVAGALEAIRASPVADVQLAAIAERAGMKPNHVLYYFRSRDDVLIAAAAHVEEGLAEGRAERLSAIADPVARLREYVATYLPEDRHDPIWKLWMEGWLRSAAHDEFLTVGLAAHERWMADLAAAVGYALAHGGALGEEPDAFARRMVFVLDGLAVHVLAGHIERGEAIELALATFVRELRLDD